MLVNRIYFIIITFILMLTLSFLLNNVILAGIITFVIVVMSYIIIAYIRSKKRLNLLQENCDPRAFINATEKQISITGKNPKLNAYLKIDIAAGFMSMGEFHKAQEILLSINKSYLSKKNGTLLTYLINLMICYYELGQTSKAEELFETEVPMVSPINEKMNLSIRILVAERLFYLKRYNASKDKFNDLLKEKLPKSNKLSILYRLAQINEKNGDLLSAKKKYKEVSDNGNKLWIAIDARKQISKQ